jgi:hypothetical protein
MSEKIADTKKVGEEEIFHIITGYKKAEEKLIVAWEISDGFWKYFVFEENSSTGVKFYTKNISIEIFRHLRKSFRQKINVPINCFVFFEEEKELDPIIHDKIAIWCLTDMLERQSERNTKLIQCFCDVVREPLNEIIHFSNILANQYSKERMFMTMNSKVVSLANSIFDVIEVVKLDNNNLEVSSTVMDIRSIIENISRLKPHISFETYIDSTVPDFVAGDPSRVQQILLNLLDTMEERKEASINLIVESQAIFEENILQHEISFKLFDEHPGQREDSFVPIELLDERNIDSPAYIKHRLSYLLAKKMGGSLLSDNTGKKLLLTTHSVSRPIVNINTLDVLRGKKCLFICNDSVKIIFCKIMEKYKVEYFLTENLDEALLLYGNKAFDFLLFRGTKESAGDAVRLKHWKSPIVGVMDRDIFVPSEIFQHSILTHMSQLFKSVMTDVVNRTNLMAPILVASDIDTVREALKNHLHENGYKDVTVIAEKKSAITEMKRKRYFIACISFENWNHHIAVETRKWAERPKLIGIGTGEEFAIFDQRLELGEINDLDTKIKKLLGYM